MNEIILGDCMDILRSIPDDSVDMVLTDPPWETTDLALDALPVHRDVYSHIRRVLKPAGWFFCFGTVEMFYTIITAGFRRKFEYIWDKGTSVPCTHNTVRPMMAHEIICAFLRDDLKKVTDAYFDRIALRTPGRPYRKIRNNSSFTEFSVSTRVVPPKDGYVVVNDGFRHPITVLRGHYPKKMMRVAERTKHPTQKPVSLMSVIVRGYCPPDGIVLDPYCGSGSACVAAKMNSRKYLGIEINPEYHRIAASRLNSGMDVYLTI